MKFVQITDLHIDKAGEQPFGIDVRKNLHDVLEAVIIENPDRLVVTGDLCYREGDEEIYRWVKAQLDALPFPYEIIAGNHDDSALMAEIFDLNHLLNDGELYYAKKWDKQLCLFLDSAVGRHSDNQIKWLIRQLKICQTNLIIFMHHPPFISGVPYMDMNHALQDMDTIQELFAEFPNQISIFTGHYHVEKTLIHNNVTQMITPSCFFQIGQTLEEFSVDHHRIAYRIIEMENSVFSSSVQYLPGNKV
ncbi:MAG: metallophosphoesterase [Saprospiraceae bacterium]